MGVTGASPAAGSAHTLSSSPLWDPTLKARDVVEACLSRRKGKSVFEFGLKSETNIRGYLLQDWFLRSGSPVLGYTIWLMSALSSGLWDRTPN